MNGVYGLLIASLGIAGLADTAQAQNMEAMMKWTTAQVVRYDVVAEYKGQTSIASIPPNSPISKYDAQVVDRYEIGFNWNPQSMAMEGAPTIRNLPTSLPTGVPAGKCGAPQLTGAYDHAEVTGAKTGLPGSNSLALSIKRSYPAVAFQLPNEKGVCTPLNAPAKADMQTSGIVVPPGMYFAMPAAKPANITVDGDGKTMTLKQKEWTYTYTMRIVK
jgi:hypothetical protein